MFFKLALGIAILISIGFVALIIYANINKKKTASDFAEMHARLGVVAVTDYPLKSELEGGGGAAAYWQSTAYRFPAGDLAGGFLIYSSLFSRRPEEVLDPVESERVMSGVRKFVTIHIPATIALDDAWLASWQPRVGQKTAHPRRTLDLVKRVPSGGVALRWEVEAMAKDFVMAVLKDLLANLPRRAAAQAPA